MQKKFKKPFAVVASIAVALGTVVTAGSMSTVFASAPTPQTQVISGSKTTTPIKHVVVIFDENVSFDHYFGTYPNATNPPGEPKFTPAPNTPTVNGLSGALLTNNPNLANPQRLDRTDENPPDNDHGYTAEQKAMDGGLMDQFVQATGNGSDTVMDYYDGNTVTGMWNYAQHFALNDNSFGTNFGPSSPGAINLISGSTHGDGAIAYSGNVDDKNAQQVATISGALDQNQTLYSDKDPYFDKDSTGTTVEMTGKNIGDLLNAKNITWGWFQGGFRNSSEKHTAVNGATSTDYVPHHEPFQFYKSTANPEHLPPSSPSMIGKTDQANHQYDLTDFWTAADSGNLPAVSFLKPPAYENAHPGNSDPLDEQTFVTNTINQLEQLPTWSSTAVIIAYDDSDGWYDHVMPPIITQSDDPNADVLVGNSGGSSHALNYPDKLGYGPRLPLLVISPYAKQNFVDNTMTDQSSILKFIEDNWNLGTIGAGDESSDAFAGTLDNMFDFSHPTAGKLFLDPSTGEPESQGAAKQQFDSYVAKVYSDAGVTQPNTPAAPVPGQTPAPGKLGKILGKILG